MIAKRGAPGLTAMLPRIAALFCALLSVLAIGVCAYLSTVKFKMTYTPFTTEHGGCGFGGMTCDDALSSSWSTFMGLPLSVWGAAFYLVVFMLSCALAWRRELLGGVPAQVLLALAALNLGVSLLLGVYTLVALPEPCPFCLTLYAVSVFLLGGVYLIWDPPGSSRPLPWAEIVTRRSMAAIDSVFLTGLVFVVAVGTQSMIYHGMRNFVDSQANAPSEVGLPPPGTRLGPDDPVVIIALFLDLSCHKCRGEFKTLAGALREGKFPAPTQLWVYHTPRQTCDPAAFPSGYAASDNQVRFDNPCLAARAVECMDKLAPNGGANMVRGLFALHDDREKDLPLFTATRIGDRAVDLGLDIDPDDPDNVLFRCIDGDAEVLARITEHQRYAEKNDLKVPTVGVYRAFGGAIDPARKPLHGDANTPLEGVLDFVAAQAAPAEGPTR